MRALLGCARVTAWNAGVIPEAAEEPRAGVGPRGALDDLVCLRFSRLANGLRDASARRKRMQRFVAFDNLGLDETQLGKPEDYSHQPAGALGVDSLFNLFQIPLQIRGIIRQTVSVACVRACVRVKCVRACVRACV